ncbi:MAG TPA: hypothetical protein VJH37_04480 [Candidatus Nanoarchaeia archaeon]|nr:hypothetical protein [Candidatus Nanoarchaeia archaeon]
MVCTHHHHHDPPSCEQKSIDKKNIADEPIVLPGSPFWNVFRRFGRDQTIATVIDIVGTGIVSLFITNILFLSLTGPIIEKIGFFIGNIKDAIAIYKTTTKEKRKSFSSYLFHGIKKGSVSLIEDLVVHDPIYILIMYFGLSTYTSTPIWLLAGAAFIFSIFVVAFIENIIDEYRFSRLKKSLINSGFKSESFLESRFLIQKNNNINEMIKKLKKHFNLKLVNRQIYEDDYLDHNFTHYSGRKPKVRIRSIKDTKLKNIGRLELSYSRHYELDKKDIHQWRFFPAKKEKFSYNLDKKYNLSELKKKELRWFTKKLAIQKGSQKINFKIILYYKNKNSNELIISIDEVKGLENLYILEVKVVNDIILLRKVMRFVMLEFPVIQTTREKSELQE